jgi:hypothetical protein
LPDCRHLVRQEKAFRVFGGATARASGGFGRAISLA